MILNQIKQQLIVSCQALEDEPLYSDFIMSKMAKAAVSGGAVAIRANSVKDIKRIKTEVNVPIIGIIKTDYAKSEVYITPTTKEIDMLAACHVEIIAMDATNREHPQETLEELVSYAKTEYPDILLMADIATIEEAIAAQSLDFDLIGTTLHGYTKETKNQSIKNNDFLFLRVLLQAVSIPVIAEGKIKTPNDARKVLELGAHSVVVGGAITRPKQITEGFVSEMKRNS